MALAVAIAVALVVVLLSISAVSLSVNSLTQSGIAGKQVTAISAAEGGLQGEINSIENPPTNTTVACPYGVRSVTGAALPAAATGFGTQVGSFTVKYAVGISGAVPLASALVSCPSAGTIPYSGSTYYLFQSTGTSTAAAVGGTTGPQTEQALVLTPVGYAPSTAFPEGTYASTGASNGSNNTFSLSGGEMYSGSGISCGSADTYTGNYVSSGYNPSTGATTPSTLGGGCSIAGNVDLNGSVLMSAGLIGGNVYTTGTVGLSGGANVTGTIYSAGTVTIGNTGQTIGSVQTGRNYVGGASVAGNIYAAGNVTIASGKITGNIYAGGTVTINGGTVTGTIYSGTSAGTGGISVTNGTAGSLSTIEAYGNMSFTDGALTGAAGYVSSSSYTISQSCTTAYRYEGPSTCFYALPNGYPLSSFVTTASVTAAVTAQIASAATAANPTYLTNANYSSSDTYPFPTLPYDQSAWTDNTSFCPAATTATPCVPTIVNATNASAPICNVKTGQASNAMCIITDTDCTAPTSGTITDTSSIWKVIANTEISTALPTVLITNCQLTEGDTTYKGPPGCKIGTAACYVMSLYNNLAIFDDNGFNLNSSFTGGVVSADGKIHQLYLVVPSSVPSTLSSSSNTEVASCSGDTTSDINFATSPSDGKIQDFFYTPNNICQTGGPSAGVVILGKVYAGDTLTASASNWSQTYAAISPWSAGATPNNPSSAVVEWIKRVAPS